MNALLRRRIREVRAAQPDAGAAMVMTILFTVFAAGMMFVLLGVLLAQLQPIQMAQKTNRTVYAAQAGIQSALAVMRSNTKVVGTETFGDPTKLPATLSGTVDGTTTSDLRYSVAITYYATSPSGKDDTWLTANKITNPGTNQPYFARLVSTGTDAAVTGLGASVGSRTITAIYAFTTTNINIPGGYLMNYAGTRCLKADDDVAGSKIYAVTTANCTDDTLNLWVYDTDWKIKLASTIDKPTVLCVTGQTWLSTASGVDNTTVQATLQPCTSPNSAAKGNQLWSWDSPGSFQGQNKTNTTRTSRWLSLSTTNQLMEGTSSSLVFNPEPAVGAGAASKATNQIVNYKEFGRCMDVTHGNINKAYMIVYPCKQDPTGTGNAINWNHKWYYNEPVAPSTSTAGQPIRVNTGSTNYCLTGSSTSTNLTFSSACTSPTWQNFIRNTETGVTLTSWTFQLASDPTKCLASSPGGNPDGEAWSVLRLLPCDGSTAQKWNAPAVTTGSKLGDYQEIG